MRIPLLAVIALPVISICFITTSQAVSVSPYDLCSNPPCFLTRGVPIQYPFGIGSGGCGHHDFQVECDNENFDTAVLIIKGRKYSVRMAFYNENTLQVVDARFAKNPCYHPNASLDFTGSPFQIASRYSNLTYWLNCSTKPINDYSQVPCEKSSYMGFSDSKAAKNSCSSVFQVPVLEVDSSDLTGNMTQEIKLWLMRMLLSKGFWIKWDEGKTNNDTCSSCQLSNGICGYNVSDASKQFLCYCKDGTHPKHCVNGGGTEKRIIIGSCIGGLAVLVAATALLLRFLSRRKIKLTLAPKNACDDSEFDQAEMGDLPIFSYRELEQATNYFDEKRELGGGGYGKVYLGKLRDGRSVAVKRFHENNCNRVGQFVNEVRILSSIRHCNLVRLFGCCKERQNLLLVCEYVPNGTLFDHLHGEQRGKNGLRWEARLKIALETASALAYLHFDSYPPIFHRDVKSTNILLDENMGVKVADFGLSRLVPLEASHVSTSPQGTPGYVDPDYNQFYQLTDKSDVYSFGVVLIEIISGKKAVDELRDGREISLAHLATTKIQMGALQELVDPDLEFESDPVVNEMITSAAELAFLCLSAEKDDRPCMMEVVTQLHRIKQLGYGCLNCRNIASMRGTIKPDSVCKATGSSNFSSSAYISE